MKERQQRERAKRKIEAAIAKEKARKIKPPPLGKTLSLHLCVTFQRSLLRDFILLTWIVYWTMNPAIIAAQTNSSFSPQMNVL